MPATANPDRGRAKELGRRLRAIRDRRHLSLAEVQEKSGGVWMATMVGSWERADRQPRIGPLLDLIAWYAADPSEVIPTGLPATVVSRETAMALPHGQVRVVKIPGGSTVYLRLRVCHD